MGLASKLRASAPNGAPVNTPVTPPSTVGSVASSTYASLSNTSFEQNKQPLRSSVTHSTTYASLQGTPYANSSSQVDSNYQASQIGSNTSSQGGYLSQPIHANESISQVGLQPPTYPPPGSFDIKKVRQHLDNIIKVNGLGRFYGQASMSSIHERVSSVDFETLAKEWSIPADVVFELSALSLYDIVVFADDSGSMLFEDGGARIGDLNRILGRIAQITTLFDDDGILIRFFNSNVEGNGIRNIAEANATVQQVKFSGMTPLGTQLEQKVLKPFFYEPIRQNQFMKPILVFIITDGEPSGEDRNKIFQVIQQCRTTLNQAGFGKGVAFEFAQVGRDVGAQAFLGRLDNDGTIGDIVDTTSYYELEAEEFSRKGINLTPDLWLLKLMLGAVDPSYDDQD